MAGTPRLFFVNRFFYPDLSATSQILTDLAFHLAAGGREVHVVTSRLGYEQAEASYPASEVIEGVHVSRVPTTRFGRAHLPGRAMDYLSFYASVFWFLLRHVTRGDIVVAKTDPPLLSVAAGLAARIKGARLVNWLQDVFPEVGAALGVRIFSGLPGRVIRRLRDRSLRAAAANVVLGRRMGQYIESRGVPAARIVLIPNWSDDADIVPLAHADNPLRREWGWTGRFVVAYSGNLGRAHEAQTLLEAAHALRDDEGILFAFIGGGARMAQARAFVEEYKLGNVRFLPYQARERLGESLAAADLHLVSLLPEMEGLIVPSKVYGIAAAGRPMAFVGDPEGEVGQLLARCGAGAAFRSGAGQELAVFIRALAAGPEEASRMGGNARRMLEAEFTRAHAFAAWRGLLDRL